MITINPDRSASIPHTEACIGFERDHLAEHRLFEIRNPKLIGCAFKLDIDNTGDIVDLSVTEQTDDRTVLRWDVTSAIAAVGGVITVQIRAFNTASELIWHSAPMDFTVGRSVDAVKDASTDMIITEFEQVERRVQTALEQCETDAKAAAETLQALLDEVGDVSETILAFGAHISDDGNPHGVTASQVGAYSAEDTDRLLDGKLDNTGGTIDGNVIFSNGHIEMQGFFTTDYSAFGVSFGESGYVRNLALPFYDDDAASKAYVDSRTDFDRERWTFTLSDGRTVEKEVAVWHS